MTFWNNWASKGKEFILITISIKRYDDGDVAISFGLLGFGLVIIIN